MYCELNTSDTHLEPLNNLYAYSSHADFDVSALAAVKNFLISDGILTKIYKTSEIIETLVFVLGFILITIAGVYWWKKSKN